MKPLPVPLRIERPSVAELPSAAYLVRLADRAEWLLLEVPTVATITAGGERVDPTQDDRERLVEALRPCLPEHMVWDHEFLPDQPFLHGERRDVEGSTLSGLSGLSIRRVIAEQAVEAHLDLLLSAATQYGALTNSLMARLAQQLGVDVSDFAADEFRHARSQMGPLSGHTVPCAGEEWACFFHGVDCLFTSTTTGVAVEARLGFGAACGNDFGTLDPGFFLHFLNTSSTVNAQYSLLTELLRDWWENARRTLEYMEQRGLLRRVSSAHDIGRGWVIAGTPLSRM